MTDTTRRQFLGTTMLAAGIPALSGSIASAASTPAPMTRRVLDDGEPLRIAVIGLRGRGRGHIGAFKGIEGCEVVALVDPDHDDAIIKTAQRSAPTASVHRDIREVLDGDMIDAVSIATPNHWHSLGAVWALQAGKHVYVEKPLTHTLREGEHVVAWARRTGLVCQHGTQARSATATREAIAWLHSGALGRVHVARGLCYKRRHSIGKVAGEITPPSTLDFDHWTGPARLEPLRRANLHYDWHWVYNTGDGDLGNQGVHQVDLARWGLGADGFPTEIRSVGGRFGYDDDGNTANSMITSYRYGDARLVFEVRGLQTDAHPNARGGIGVVWHCDEGTLVSVSYSDVQAFDNTGNLIRRFQGGNDHAHFRNFVEAARAGDPTMLNAECVEGHLSSGLCQLGNVSYRLAAEQGLGEQRPLGSCETPFDGDDVGNEAMRRMRAHLAASGVDESSDCTVGPTLSLDPGTSRFWSEHATAAETLARGSHRAGYTFDLQA